VTDPQPGDFELTKIAGEGGELIRIGQLLNGDGFEDYEHARLYLGGGQVLEAEPGGARIVPVGDYGDGLWSTGKILLTDAQRTAIVKAAHGYVGVPYSAADYFALAAHRLHIPAPGLETYVASSGHMICSQLVDRCYQDAGVQLFDDHRWCGYVTPGSLYQLLA
jgi:cell wall-associated NlpC family hydrolase